MRSSIHRIELLYSDARETHQEEKKIRYRHGTGAKSCNNNDEGKVQSVYCNHIQ